MKYVVPTEPGYLYYVTSEGHIGRAKLMRSGKHKKEKTEKINIEEIKQ